MALTAEPIPATLDRLLADLSDDGRVVHVERLDPRPERHAPLARALPDEVRARVPVDRFWVHQAQAIDLVRDRRSVVVATGTASGKSLCYQVPIAEAVADRVRPASALALFPTKALAHDQLRALAVADYPGVIAATYDGDTPSEHRAVIRRTANVVLTNPEMLHAGILPHHSRWATFLGRLRHVVIDELHVLRGVFGTHVAHILRRLRRVCAEYGADPTFVFCSATIGQPDELASALCGLPVTPVLDDGSPAGYRRFALLNPPVIDEVTGVRTSGNSETASAVAGLVEAGHRTIAFCRSRKGTELVAADVARRLPDETADLVRPYRGGYLAEERRAIEGELAAGTVRAVVATTALELGVDIGGLDACVLNGFPGTIASMWQQAGRVGREQQDSLSVLVAGEDQLDQWLMAHPREVFSRPPEPAVINPTNPYILDPHLACAAFELPLSHADERYWAADDLADGVRRLVLTDKLRVRSHRDWPVAVWTARGFPARGVSLRSGGTGEYRIMLDDGTLVGTVDDSRAFEVVHPGAIYLHRGESYRVAELDRHERVAIVTPADGTEYTQARIDTRIRICATAQTRTVGASSLSLGDVEVTRQVTGYQRKEIRTRRILANEPLDLPPQRLVTRAFWYSVDAELLTGAGIAHDAVGGTLHAAEHTAIGILPLFTICDRWDVGGVSTPHHGDTARPTIFVYDGYPGGAGIAELGYQAAERHLAAARDVIASCPCADGCPSCVQSPKCGNGNEPLDKRGAVVFLDAVLG